MIPIVPGVFTFTGLLVGRVYCIADPDGLTLIDTGMSLAAPRILRQLAAAGHRPGDVRRILITHAHPDHIGGLPELQARTGAQVIASAADRPVIEGREPAPRPPRETLSGPARLMWRPGARAAPTPVDRVVADGETLPDVLDGLQVIATPGHTPGHLAFWQPARRLLFCGDLIMHTAGLRLPIAAFTVDMAQNRRSIGHAAALTPAVVCFGHGAPLMKNAAAAVQTFAARVAA